MLLVALAWLGGCTEEGPLGAGEDIDATGGDARADAEVLAPRPPRLEAAPALQDRVRAEVAHAWGAYRAGAWGRDELRPLSGTGADWHAAPLGLTVVDALDTLVLVGLHDEATEAREWIARSLDLDADIDVSVFETNIRLLGGLLSGYALTDDIRLLRKAEDLGDRLLPAFDSPSGLPWRKVNLRTGVPSGQSVDAAEAGTFLLEFAALSRWTGNPAYLDAARRATLAVHAARSPATHLVASGLDVVHGTPELPVAQVGGGVDSYYEYLYKGALFLDDAALRDAFRVEMEGVNTHLAERVGPLLWYGIGDADTGELIAPLSSSLACFMPGLLTLSGDLERGLAHGEACWTMWDTWSAAPDLFDYREMTLFSANYELRPELIESLFYLLRATRDPVWRDRGERVLDDLIGRCRVPGGYAVLASVVDGRHNDAMPSYFLAETLKYLWLLFAAEDALPLDTWVLNTEAHPLPLPPR